MAAWGTRQAYPAVTWTMTILVGMFTLTALFRPLIPPPEPNAVVQSPGDFMRGASKQRILWRTLRDQPFAEAKRLDRPLFLVIGNEWNAAGRYFDTAVLGDPEVAERLNRQFVPVRIDASIDEEWSFGPVPIASAQSGTDPGWLIIVLQPDGKPLAWLGQTGYNVKYETRSFQTLLTLAQRDMQSSQRKGNQALVERTLAESDYLMGRLSGGGGDLSLYAASLLDQLNNQHEFTESGVRRLFPWEWRFLLTSGHLLDATNSLTRLGTSNAVDWIDGGFFRIYGPGTVKYDKIAIESCDLTTVFAVAGVRSDDAFFRALARSSFDKFLAEFLREDTLYGWSFMDPQAFGRSPRHPVSPSLVLRRFSGPDTGFISKFLGVDPSSDPTMLPHVTIPADYLSRPENYERVLKHWAEISQGKDANYGGSGLASTACEVYARLAETARLLGDSARLESLDPIYKAAAGFRVGPEDVQHSTTSDVRSIAFLGDYTAYAEACLQRFLATGDIQAINSGRAVLNRAWKIFATDTPGVLGLVPRERVAPSAPWTQLPNALDGSRGSIAGEVVRLTQAYSCIYRDAGFGQEWRKLALTQVSQLARLTADVKIRLGCLAYGMSQTLADRYAVVCGPEANLRASTLSSANPEVLVFAAQGDVRRDLQAKGKGVYVVVQGEVRGPMGDQAARALLGAMP